MALGQNEAGQKLMRFCQENALVIVNSLSILMKVKEKSEKAGLRLNIQKMKTTTSGPITSWQIDGETVETVADYFSGVPNHCTW